MNLSVDSVLATARVFDFDFLDDFSEGEMLDPETLREKKALVELAFLNKKLTANQRRALNWLRILIKNREKRFALEFSNRDKPSQIDDVDEDFVRCMTVLENTNLFPISEQD